MKGRTNVSGGIVLNATTANCIVEDGNTIVAGDFVQTSYHPTVETTTLPLVNHGDRFTPIHHVLGNGDILKVYFYVPTSNYEKANVYFDVYDGETLQNVNQQSSSMVYGNMYSCSFVNLSDDHFLMVVMRRRTTSSNNMNLGVFDISYNTTTKVLTINDVTFDLYTATYSNYSYYTVDAIKYDSTHVILWYNTYLSVYDITTHSFVSSKSSCLENRYNNAQPFTFTKSSGLYFYDTNKFVAIAYGYIANYVIDETTYEITEINRYNSTETGTGSRTVRISERIFASFNAYKSSASGQTNLNYLRYKVNSDDTINVETAHNDTSYDTRKRYPYHKSDGVGYIFDNQISVAQITEDDFVDYERIYNTEIYELVGIQQMAGNAFRVMFYPSSSDNNTRLLNCVIADNEISPSADTTYVKQYATRCNGVAKQNGSAGDTISVYIPLANS